MASSRESRSWKRGNHYDRRIGEFALQIAQPLQTALSGYADIEDYQLRCSGSRSGEAVFEGVGNAHLVALAAEMEGHRAAARDVVVDDEDAAHRRLGQAVAAPRAGLLCASTVALGRLPSAVAMPPAAARPQAMRSRTDTPPR